MKDPPEYMTNLAAAHAEIERLREAVKEKFSECARLKLENIDLLFRLGAAVRKLAKWEEDSWR